MVRGPRGTEQPFLAGLVLRKCKAAVCHAHTLEGQQSKELLSHQLPQSPAQPHPW